ncbi:hypothetical protein [Cylindrospermum stagnale]|uniref:hypothetical protein n=1 Tax=Cylindrospermum stagnale TaxID=142864 RepID=UPI00059CB60B|nr:hypothetical protein [Cylindrospermum stagnale]
MRAWLKLVNKALELKKWPGLPKENWLDKWAVYSRRLIPGRIAWLSPHRLTKKKFIEQLFPEMGAESQDLFGALFLQTRPKDMRI